MAQRRMFSMHIIDTDNFLEMPMSTQALYFHLGMRADDDGFVSSPKRILRMMGCSEDDMRILVSKGFVIPFQSGVCVIRHWKMHNYIQKDRYKETMYKEQKELLITDDNGIYKPDTECIQNGHIMDTQVRLVKSKGRVGEESINTDSPTAEVEPQQGQLINSQQEPKTEKKALSPMKDKTANEWQSHITAIQPTETWANFPLERQQLNNLGKKTKALLKITPFGSESELIDALFKKYLDMRQTEKGSYWKGAPITPSAIVTRWDKVTTALAQDYQEHEAAYNYDAAEAKEFF